MKEKRIGFRKVRFLKALAVSTLCAALVITGCGSSRPLSESGAESSSEAASMASIVCKVCSTSSSNKYNQTYYKIFFRESDTYKF